MTWHSGTGPGNRARGRQSTGKLVAGPFTGPPGPGGSTARPLP